MSLFDQLSEHENQLIEQFRQHPYIISLPAQDNNTFKRMLVQNTFLSRNFVPWYVRGMLGMQSEEGKEILRDIALEEMGVEQGKIESTHMELLLCDLNAIEISSDYVLDDAQETRATRYTRQAIDDIIPAVYDYHYDLKTLVGLRMAGEVLVGEAYKHICRELENRFGMTKDNSQFYWPHFLHDAKDSELGDHTRSFEATLTTMIDTPAKLDIAKDTATQAYHARVSFYNQFLPLRRRSNFRAGLALAAMAAVMVGSPIAAGHYMDLSDIPKGCIPNAFDGIEHCVEQ
jgi:hypothetical protein